jgi:hypothetical protein
MHRPRLYYYSLALLWACIWTGNNSRNIASGGVSASSTTRENSLLRSLAILVVIVVVAIPPTTVKAETVLPETSTRTEALSNDESDQIVVDRDSNDDDDDNNAVTTDRAYEDAACRDEDEMTMSSSSTISTVVPDETLSLQNDVPNNNTAYQDTDDESSSPENSSVEEGRQPEMHRGHVNDLTTREVTPPLQVEPNPTEKTVQAQEVHGDSDISTTIPDSILEFISLPPVLMTSGENVVDDRLGSNYEGNRIKIDPATMEETNSWQSQVYRKQVDGGNESIVGGNEESLLIHGPDQTREVDDDAELVHTETRIHTVAYVAEPPEEASTSSMQESQEALPARNVSDEEGKAHDASPEGVHEHSDKADENSITRTMYDSQATADEMEHSSVEHLWINMESKELQKGGLAMVREEQPPHSDRTAVPEEDIDELDSMEQDDAPKQNDSLMQTLTERSFENQASQDDHLSAVQEAEASGSKYGLPWGTIVKTTRRIPDAELLYRFFRDRLNADGNFWDRPQAEARFPLSMGHQVDTSFESGDLNGMPGAQADIDKLVYTSDEAAKKIIGFSTKNPNNSSFTSSADYEPITGSADSEDADGLRDLFQGVDPPDELDVGAASGSSMQEFLVGKSKEILVRRVSLGIKLVQRLLATFKQKVESRFARVKEWVETPTGEHEVVGSRRLENRLDGTGRQTMHSLRSAFHNALQFVVQFFHKIIEGVEDDGNDMVDALGEEMDFDAIRKMSGLKA